MKNETLWTERKPGSPVSQGTDDPTVLLLGGKVSDWVRTPPGLPDIEPGVKLRVIRAFGSPCPQCVRLDTSNAKHPNVQHIQVEQGYRIAECETPGHGFVWYK